MKKKKTKFSVHIRWGSDPEQKSVCEYSFDTAEELEAFLKGVDEASGWMDYTIVSDDGEEL